MINAYGTPSRFLSYRNVYSGKRIILLIYPPPHLTHFLHSKQHPTVWSSHFDLSVLLIFLHLTSILISFSVPISILRPHFMFLWKLSRFPYLISYCFLIIRLLVPLCFIFFKRCSSTKSTPAQNFFETRPSIFHYIVTVVKFHPLRLDNYRHETSALPSIELWNPSTLCSIPTKPTVQIILTLSTVSRVN